MNIASYLMESRGIINTARRLPVIALRFGLRAEKMERSLRAYTEITRAHNCRPTLAVTSVLLERHPDVFRWLAEEAELAVHGYVHTDYSELTEQQQMEHMERSLSAFHNLGLHPTGFRCPYLRWNPASITVARRSGLSYGSNRSLAWECIPNGNGASALQSYKKGLALYGARPVALYPSLPSFIDGFLDIPASEPDDEAMIDRLGLPPSERAATWKAMLEETHGRGELLTLILHHERVPLCGSALDATLSHASGLSPHVWVAPLSEIAGWWARRASLRISIEPLGENRFRVTPPVDNEATVLVRGATATPALAAWQGAYQIAPLQEFTLTSSQPPVISLAAGANPALKAFLEDEGYIVGEPESGGFAIQDFASFCEDDQRKVLGLIEASDAPLVRLWRWPNAARCALSITGDIDAMTLVDFLRRPLEV